MLDGKDLFPLKKGGLRGLYDARRKMLDVRSKW